MLVDEVDRKILSLMKQDARLSFAEIGEQVHLSAPAVHARVKKMEKNGVITRHTVDLAPDAMGTPLCAFIRVARSKGTSAVVAKKLAKIKQIEECHAVAGEDCLFLKVRVANAGELSKIIDEIRETDSVERTTTAVVLETHFERGLQP